MWLLLWPSLCQRGVKISLFPRQWCGKQSNVLQYVLVGIVLMVSHCSQQMKKLYTITENWASVHKQTISCAGDDQSWELLALLTILWLRLVSIFRWRTKHTWLLCFTSQQIINNQLCGWHISPDTDPSHGAILGAGPLQHGQYLLVTIQGEDKQRKLHLFRKLWISLFSSINNNHILQLSR